MHSGRSHRCAAFLLLLAACSTAPTGLPGSPGSSNQVGLTRFRSDSFAFALLSGFATPETMVIRTEAGWADAWSRINARVVPQPPRPSVDFTRDVVLLAAQGNQATGGYNILLDSAEEAGGGITVKVTETSPGPGCIVTQMLTQPVDIARLPRVETPVTFVVTPHATVCAP